MNTKRFGMVLAAAGIAVATVAWGAAPPASAPTTTAPANAAQPASSAAASKGQRAVPAPGDRMCVRDTGSHIPPKQGQCLPVAGRSYDQQDLQRTGALDVGQALRMLDPSLTVRGH